MPDFRKMALRKQGFSFSSAQMRVGGQDATNSVPPPLPALLLPRRKKRRLEPLFLRFGIQFLQLVVAPDHN